MHATALARPAVKTALWVFLGVATSLFVLFVSAYAMRLNFVDWTPLPQPRLLMLNTALLVVAPAWPWSGRCIAARRADGERRAARPERRGLLTFGFLAGQLVVWKQFSDAGYFSGDQCCHRLFLPAYRRAWRCTCSAAWWPGAARPGACTAAIPRAASGSASSCARSTGISC